MRRFRRHLAGLLCGVLLAFPALAETATVLLGEPSGSAAEFARVLEGELAATHPGLRLQKIGTATEADAGSRLLIAVGSRSLQQALSLPRAPLVVAALVPSSVFDDLAVRGRASAVFLDQPPARQLALLNLLLPDARRVGVLVGRAQRKYLGPLAQAAESMRLQLQVSLVENRDGLFDALQQVAARSDVLLAWPDATVFNPQTIQSILLTTYRQRVPLLGFSTAYTKAGALASVHSSVPQMAAQTADLVRAALAGSLPAPQYPREFEVSLNRQVGRSLGIELPDERMLVEQMRAREGKLKP